MTNVNKDIEEGISLRADHINFDDVSSFNVDSDFSVQIQKELMNNQLRLLVGPRGTGKTHQMKMVCDICKKNKHKPLTLFVSFNRYYRLDKFSITSDTVGLFHNWVLFKVLLSAYIACEEQGLNIERFENLSKEDIERIINKIESINVDNYILPIELNIGSVIEYLSKTINYCNRKRCILLFDDAALVLSPQFLYEFLEMFKNFKTQNIAPKASVYQGTEYKNPRVHINQEGNLIYSWLDVNDENYLPYMHKILIKRFPEISIESDIIDYLAYASFGITRSFISYIEQYTNSTNKTPQSKINNIINESCTFIEQEHLSMKHKKPLFENVIDTSWKYFIKLVELVRVENKNSPKNVEIYIASEKADNPLIETMHELLIESGLLHKETIVSHGEDRKYEVFVPNYLFLINNKTFSVGKGTIKEVLSRIKEKSKKHGIRRNAESVFPGILSNLKLNLQPCQNCNTPRLNENAIFCHNCGTKLISKNIFDELFNIPISDLPLTNWRKNVILEQGKFKTILDYEVDRSPIDTLKKIRGISDRKAEQIIKIFDNFIKEFLN